MAWVVDTSVLLDIRLNDPAFGVASATCLARRLKDGLTLCPVSYIELAPAFGGDPVLQHAFLRQTGVHWLEPWKWQDTAAAHGLWAAHVAKKRQGSVPKRPAENGGMGLEVARMVCDDLRIQATRSGTQVRLRMKLR